MEQLPQIFPPEFCEGGIVLEVTPMYNTTFTAAYKYQDGKLFWLEAITFKWRLVPGLYDFANMVKNRKLRYISEVEWHLENATQY